MPREVEDLLHRVRSFEAEAHNLLARYESARQSRVIQLDETYRQLSLLNLKQDDLFRQALRCAENGLYRSGHVMAWAGFMDFLQEKLTSDGLAKLHAMYPKWASYQTVEDLRESVNEFTLIEAAYKLGICSKPDKKTIHGLLSTRNEAAHPSDFSPGLNETLGFVEGLLKRVQKLDKKTL